jgi:hypothetical protein
MTNEELLLQLNNELQLAIEELNDCVECNPDWEKMQMELISSIEQEINALNEEL